MPYPPMQGATHGDFTHGLIHPEQMIGRRLLVAASAHATPIPDLYLCGASCHPGPGVASRVASPRTTTDNSTRTLCVFAPSLSGTEKLGTGSPSNSTDRTRRPVPAK
jgi:hypothetical protein